MNAFKRYFGFGQTLIALSVLAAFGPARAADAPDIAQLTAPGTSSVSVGIGGATGDSKDRARFGLYNGLRKDSAYGLLGFDYVNADDATGRWTIFEGRNLGLDSRELGFTVRQLGEWKLYGQYGELVRHDPRTINTGLVNAGTTTPTVVLLGAPGTGQELNLELKRKGLTLGGEKWFGNSLQLEVNFKNEDKDGARLFGKGFACASGAAPGCLGPTATRTGWALLLLPEPINSTIRQLDAKLTYSGDRLLLTGGYYGSFYTNANGNLTPTVPATLNNALGTPLPLNTGLQSILQLPMALPPDNQAHQLYLSGNFRFTPTTRATFKYAYTHATQHEDFLSMGLANAPVGVSNLGGVVDTNLAQVGLTARPIPKLSLLANVRYEDKKDKTPIYFYNIEGATTFTNSQNSSKRLTGKLEGSYQLPAGLRATLGLDYESLDRGKPVATTQIAGLSALRQKTDETGYRLELRRAMSETLTGSLSYASHRRNGSAYLSRVPGAGFPEVSDATISAASATNVVVPAMLMDRTRDKWKALANWSPGNRLSLQFWVEDGKDNYSGPAPSGAGQPNKGLRDNGLRFYSLDAAYTLSDAWKLTAYYSYGDQVIHVNHSTGYQVALRDRSDSIGLGIVGKPSGRLQMGADLSYINERNIYDQTLSPGASATNTAFLAASGGVPDVTFRQLRLKVFGQYAVQKNSYVRLDLVHYRSYLNEWTWGYAGVPFAFSDNTIITAKQDQHVTFIGASYIYKFK